MKTKFNLLCKALFLTALFNTNANAQIAITNVSEIAKVKNGTTYIAMKDPNAPKAKEFVEAIKNSWTLSKFEFIKYSEIEKYIAPTSSFLTIGGYETNAQFTTLYRNGSSKNGINWSNTHIYLELWTCSDKYFAAKKKKAFDNKDKNQVARIELFTDFPTLMNPDNLYQTDYDASGHIRNWSPAILKNYIQSLTMFVNKGEEKKLYDEVINKAEVKNLANTTLFVPDYVLTKFNKFTGDESKKHDEKDIFEDYKFNYKLISTDELNTKILNDKNPFFYMIYIKSSTDKFVSVINSATGELIYSAYEPVSYNLKADDMDDLYKKIKKS